MKTVLNTYLNKYLNEMFDNLLNKALEEKPLIITNNGRVKYTYIDFYFGKHDVEINIKNINNSAECGFFRLKLTDNQKKMRDKIFDKWKEEGAIMQDNIQIRTLTNWFQHQTGFNHCILDVLWYDPVKLLEIKKPTKLLNQKFKTEVDWLKERYSLIMANGAILKDDVLLDYLYIGQYDDDDIALLLCINNEVYDIKLVKHIIEENKGKIDFVFLYNPTENMYMYLSGTMREPCKYQLYYVNKKILIDNKYIISGNNMSLIKETMGKLKSAIKDDRVDFAIVDIRNKKVCVEDTIYIYHPEANSLTLEA